MKNAVYDRKVPQLFLSVLVAHVLGGCARDQGTPSGGESASGFANESSIVQSATESEQADHQRRIREAVAYGAKLSRQNGGIRPASAVRLPNVQLGPGIPQPLLANYYTHDDRYPAYLLCQYDIAERDYHRSNESEWFRAALEQVRDLGPKKFPAVKWVAVVIFNRAEHAGASTFEQCFRAGAIFSATNVFDFSRTFEALVANSKIDSHPFKYDLQQPTPVERQRWLMVERHAATNEVIRVPEPH